MGVRVGCFVVAHLHVGNERFVVRVVEVVHRELFVEFCIIEHALHSVGNVDAVARELFGQSS